MGAQYLPLVYNVFAGLSPVGRVLALALCGMAAVGGLVSGIVVRNVTMPASHAPLIAGQRHTAAMRRPATPVPVLAALQPSNILTNITAIDEQVAPGGTLHVAARVVLASDEETPVPHVLCVLSFPSYHGSSGLLPSQQSYTATTGANGQCIFAAAVPNDAPGGSYYARVLAKWGAFYYWYERVFAVSG
jgi:hypothetical protein